MRKIKLLFRVDVDEHNLYSINETYDSGEYEQLVRRVVYALDAMRNMLIRGLKL